MAAAVWEQGCVQVIKFIPQLSSVFKKQVIYVLSIWQCMLQKIQIVRNTSHDHIALCCFIARPLNAFESEKGFCFMKRERFQKYSARLAIEQSSFIARYIFWHPGCCRTTNYKYKVIASWCPVIPKPFKQREEFRLGSIKPWHLINKHYLFFFLRQCLKVFPELSESFPPVWRHRMCFSWFLPHFVCKIFKLEYFWSFICSGQFKSKFMVI